MSKRDDLDGSVDSDCRLRDSCWRADVVCTAEHDAGHRSANHGNRLPETGRDDGRIGGDRRGGWNGWDHGHDGHDGHDGDSDHRRQQ